MKRILKTAGLVLLGSLLCYALMFGLYLHRAMRSAALMGGLPEPLDKLPFKEETETKQRVQQLYYRGDVDGLNHMLSVREGEVDLRIHGAEVLPVTHTPVAEVVIVNQSNRNLTMFHPHIARLTVESYDYQGYLQDDFSLVCPVSLRTQCHVLAPGQKLSIPVLFEVTGTGRHKINLSGGFPVYKELSSRSSASETPVIVRAQYVFEIQEGDGKNAQPTSSGDAATRAAPEK